MSSNKPKNPQYAPFSERQVSFKNWPTHLGIEPDLLAEAGFVYTGIGDIVRCYHCDGALWRWKQGENPWWKHAKWFSECPHVVLTKGQPFIDKVLNTDCIEEDPSKPNKPDKENDPMESSAALSCVEMGYDKTLVQKAVKKYIDDKGSSNFKAIELSPLCEELQDCDSLECVPASNVVEKSNAKNVKTSELFLYAIAENVWSNNIADSDPQSSGRSESEVSNEENARVSSYSIANSVQSWLERSEPEASSAEHGLLECNMSESVSSNNIIDSVQPSSERNERDDRSALNVALRTTNFNEDLLNHQVRLNTFVNWPGRANCNTWELAYAGFYFHGISRNADLLRCVFCGLMARNWRIDDSPWLYHAKYARECINFLAKKGIAYLNTVHNANPRLLTLQRALDLPLVYSVSTGNMCVDLYELIDRGLRLTYTPYMYHLNDGTNYYPPTYPAFLDYYDRLQSFQGYNCFGGVMEIQELAHSGQVYQGPGPLTYCFHCGDEFTWNNGIVEPWERHARKKPNCLHVIFSKGECFLEKVILSENER